MAFNKTGGFLHNHSTGLLSLAVCSDGYIAASSNKDILICHANSQTKLLRLIGHGTVVQKLCFLSDENGSTLISAASDYLIKWNIQDLIEQQKNGLQLRGKVICESAGDCHALAVSPSHTTLSVVYDQHCDIINLNDSKVVQTVEDDNIQNSIFITEDEICFISNTRNILLWNIRHCDFIDTDTENLPLPGTGSIALSSFDNSLFVGTSEGKLFKFEVNGVKIKQAFVVDLNKELVRQAINENSENIGSLLHTHIFDLTHSEARQFINNQRSCTIYCTTDRAILAVHSRSHEVEILKYDDADVTSTLFSNVAISCDINNNVYCAAAQCFQPKVEAFSYSSKVSSITEKLQNISLKSDQPLLANSKLKARMQPIAKKPTTSKKAVKDNPVTFKSKVKSSGYTSAPRMKMFVPDTKRTVNSNVLGKSKSKKSVSNTKTACFVDWSKPENRSSTIKVSEKECNINKISVSENHKVCLGLADSSIHVLNSTNSNSRQKTYSGHSNSVIDINWSQNGKYAISCSVDGTASVWNFEQSDKPIMNVRYKNHNFPGQTSANSLFSKEITHCQFYYMDTFYLLASGNTFFMYKYSLDENVNDLKRYENNSRYKLVQEFQSSDAQQITALTSPNNIYSYVVITAASDRSVIIYDMNIGKEITKLPDAHSRPVHALCQTTGSRVVSCNNFDTFVTTAVSDGVKLWDLRLKKAVVKYSSHPNNTKCDVTISPCGNYVTAATDNRQVAIYDTRNSSLVQKLARQSDKVNCITFDKTSAKIICGLQNGHMSVFSNT